MQMIGRSDLAEDSTLADNAGRSRRADELDAAIGAWTGQHDAGEVLKRLASAQVPSGKIYSMADIAADAQYLARDMIRRVTLADGTPLKVPGIVPRLSETPGDLDWVGPELGEHTEAVLAAHGYAPDEITGLRKRKAV
jgi:formyl-CoA transferase